MTNLKTKIKTQLIDGASTVQEIAVDIVDATSADVQAALIEMDDAGDVLMRNGWYRLSERARGGNVMTDLVKRLRSIDQMSVEDCFLQSYLYTKAADRIEELEAKLAEVTAERDEWKEAFEDLQVKLNWVLVERDETFALMLDRTQTAEAKLAEVTAERDKYEKRNRVHFQWWIEADNEKKAAEAMLPRAYRAGVEDVCRCKTYEPDCYQGQESMDKVPDGRWLDIDEIRAQPTPTSVELLARFKDKNDE